MKESTSTQSPSDTITNLRINNDHSNSFAKPALYALSSITGALILLTTPFLRRYSGAPYVPSTSSAQQVITKVWNSFKHKSPPAKMIDLGCGNGQLLIRAAKDGISATGVELNPWLVLLAKRNAWLHGVHSLVNVHWKDLWTINVSRTDFIIVYGVPGMMDQLKYKLQRECDHKSLVCSNMFPIPGWKPNRIEKGVWIYKVGDQIETEANEKSHEAV